MIFVGCWCGLFIWYFKLKMREKKRERDEEREQRPEGGDWDKTLITPAASVLLSVLCWCFLVSVVLFYSQCFRKNKQSPSLSIMVPPVTRSDPGIWDPGGNNETQRDPRWNKDKGELLTDREGARNWTFKGFYLSWSWATSQMFTPQQTLEVGEETQTPTRILLSM